MPNPQTTARRTAAETQSPDSPENASAPLEPPSSLDELKDLVAKQTAAIGELTQTVLHQRSEIDALKQRPVMRPAPIGGAPVQRPPENLDELIASGEPIRFRATATDYSFVGRPTKTLIVEGRAVTLDQVWLHFQNGIAETDDPDLIREVFASKAFKTAEIFYDPYAHPTHKARVQVGPKTAGSGEPLRTPQGELSVKL